MCGLVGMMGDFVQNDYKAFKTLLLLDVLRGEDSTGVAVVGKANDKIEVFKEVGAPHYLLDSSLRFDSKGVYAGSAKVMIGHNRAATKGKVTPENAHPFHHGDIVGAHNGTLYSVSKLEDGDKFDVDSEAIFYNLATFDKSSDVIACLQGAYALTWYDDADKTMNIIRNKERTLYWSRREDDDAIFWASESWMLSVALNRAGIKHTEPVAFETDTLYRFDVSDMNRGNMRKRKWRIKKDVFGYKYVAPERKDGGTSKSNPFPASHTTTTSSNSCTASFKGGTELTKERVAELRALEDQTIDFKFGDMRIGQGSTPYLSAYPADIQKDYDIRIFSHNHKNHKDWGKKKHGAVHTGKVKRFVQNFVRGKREAYLLIDLRSIVEKAEQPKEALADRIPFDYTTNTPADGMFYMGYNGAFLTYDEITNCASHGCAGCTSPIDPKDRYVFVDHDEFLCSDCMNHEFYQQFYPNLFNQKNMQQLGGV